MGKYDDIINLPHYQSPRRTPMAMEARAAQFAPFAALTGHEAAIAETARTTATRAELTSERLAELSRLLTAAIEAVPPAEIDITWFRPDARKAGGEYVTLRGTVRKVEPSYNLLTLSDGIEIPLDAISDISLLME